MSELHDEQQGQDGQEPSTEAKDSVAHDAQLRAALGPWQDPPAILVSGESGLGKTIAGLKAFGDGAVVLQMPGGSRGWNRVLGLPEKQLRTKEVADLRAARAEIRKIRKWNSAVRAGKVKGRVVWAAVVDDLTLLAHAEMRRLRNEISRADNFFFHEQLKSAIHGFAHECRFAGLFLYANAHLRRPDDKGPGGPAMPVASLVPAVPHIFDTSVIALGEDDRKPWPTVLHCYSPGSLYTCKDRHHIFRDPSPMNIRELLNAAGYRIPRMPGMEWQDRVAEELAGQLLNAGSEWGALFPTIWAKRMSVLAEKSAPPQTVLRWRWALEDGRDRHEIQLREKAVIYEL